MPVEPVVPSSGTVLVIQPPPLAFLTTTVIGGVLPRRVSEEN